jgi:ABC-type Fe3+-citrate transport system substrate-binding protein
MMGRGRREKVYLTEEQRDNLEKISRNGQASAKKILPARILLMSDEGEGMTKKWTDEAIAAALPIPRNTVGRVVKNFWNKAKNQP